MSLGVALLVTAALGTVGTGAAGVYLAAITTVSGVRAVRTFVRNERAGQAAAWRQTAEAFGLRERRVGPVVRAGEPELELYGEVDGVSVRVRRVSVNRFGAETRLTDVVVGGLQDGVVVTPLVLGRKQSILLGHSRFDRVYSVQGEASRVHALLGVGERRVLLRARRFRATVGGGKLRLRHPGWIADPKEQIALVARAISFVEELRGECDSMVHRLAANVDTEVHTAARRRTLSALLEVGGPVAHGKVAQLIDDADPHVRCQSAWHLGRQDVLAHIAGDRSVDSAIRAKALRAAPLARPEPTQAPALATVLLSHDDDLLWVGVEVVREHRLLVALPWLEERFEEAIRRRDRTLVERTRRGTHARHLARALRALRTIETEPLLIELLQIPDAETRAVAIAALGEVGSLEAVPALVRTSAQSWGGSAEAMQAIRAIQERAGPAGVGALSLVQRVEEHGAISLVDAAPAT